MSLPPSKNDREFQSHRSGDNVGETKVAVIVEQPSSSPIPIALPNGISLESKQDIQILQLDEIKVKLDTINSNLDSVESKQDLQTTQLNAINANTDTLESLAASTNTKLDTLISQTDTLEANTDGLEALITSTNTKLDTANTHLTALEGFVDQIEGFTDGIEGLIGTTNKEIGATNETIAPSDTSTSGLNGLTKRVNQHLTTIEGYVDGLEGLVTSTNTKLDTANTHLTNLEGFVDGLEGFTDGIEGLIGTTNTEIGATNEASAAADNSTSGLNGLIKRINAHLTTIEGYVDGLEALVTTTNTEIGATNETAPVSDTASSGLNGRLQRIAQRLTTLIAFYSADFGTSTGAIRVAALPGNASGIADFNAGTTGAQTPRVTANVTRNGTELDYNYGTVSGNSPRVASQIGNATGAADFNYGNGGAQTQRVISVGYEGTQATYSAAASGIVPVASATDIFTITGSSTKTVKITRISLTMSTTPGGGLLDNLVLLKRSTANSAGTSTTMTNVPHDSTFAAGTAVVRAYTANPTTGTLVGNIRAERAALENAGLIVSRLIWDFGNRGNKTLVLRGVNEVLAINLSATTITGGKFSADVEWVEE